MPSPLLALLALLAPGQGAELPPGAAEALRQLQARVEAHRHLRKLAWEPGGAEGRVLLLLEKPAKERPAFAPAVRGAYLPWAAELERQIDARLVEPFGLVRRADRPFEALAVLQFQGGLDDCARSEDRPTGAWAHFDPRLGVVLAHGELGAQPERLLRWHVLHELARAALDAHRAPDAPAPRSLVLAYGVPSYFAFHLGNAPETLGKPALVTAYAEAVATALSDPQRRAALAVPLAELIGVADERSFRALVDARAKALQAPAVPWSEHEELGRALALAWAHFLMDGEEGRHRAAFGGWIAAQLRGAEPVVALRAALAPLDPAELDLPMLRHTLRELARAPVSSFDAASWPQLLDGFAPVPMPHVVPGGGVAAAGGIGLAPGDVQARHALALWRAREGAVEAAAASLQELLAVAAEGPFGRRIEADLERLRGLAALRQAWLRELHANGERSTFELGERKLVARVAALEGGQVELDSTRSGSERVPLDALAPAPLAQRMGKRAPGEEWLRCYAYVLGGDPRWERLLDAATPQARALRADASEWIPGLLRLGEAAAALEALAARADDADPQPVLDQVRDLLARHGELELVRSRLSALRARARMAQGRLYGPERIAELVHGDLRVDDGRIRVTWEFDEADEALDFQPLQGYEAWWREKQVPLADPRERGFEVRRGALRGIGALASAVPLTFAPPATVRYTLEYGAGSGSAAVLVLLLDDGQGNHAAHQNLGDLWVTAGGHQALAIGQMAQLESGRPYELGLEVRDGDARAWVGRGDAKTVASGHLPRGRLVLMAHTQVEVRIERLQLEAALDEECLAALRDAWVEAQLADVLQ